MSTCKLKLNPDKTSLSSLVWKDRGTSWKHVFQLISWAVHSALLIQSKIWVCGSVQIFPCPSMFRMSAKFVLLNSDVSVLAVNALVSCWLDYCNSLFRSLSKFNLHKLQCIQNSAARIVSNISRYTSITPVLKKLHWLPVEQCTVFKTATLVYKFLHPGFPRYFAPYLSSYSSSYSTRHS